MATTTSRNPLNRRFSSHYRLPIPPRSRYNQCRVYRSDLGIVDSFVWPAGHLESFHFSPTAAGGSLCERPPHPFVETFLALWGGVSRRVCVRSANAWCLMRSRFAFSDGLSCCVTHQRASPFRSRKWQGRSIMLRKALVPLTFLLLLAGLLRSTAEALPKVVPKPLRMPDREDLPHLPTARKRCWSGTTTTSTAPG